MAMLPKTQRLTRAEFAPLLKGGQRFFAPTLCAVCLRTPHSTRKGKIGVVVSKKVAPQSVARHRMRREMYTAVRQHLCRLDGMHIAFIAKKQVGNVNDTALCCDVEDIVGQIERARGIGSACV